MSSIINYVADGSTNTFQIPFTYISQSHVVVTVDGVSVTPTFINDTQLSVSPTPTTGLIVIVKRVTPVVALVDFTDGSTLFEADLDLAHQQNRFIAEESRDRSDNAIATLNANITNINTVAASNAAVTSVSSNIASVNAVSTNMAEVLLADTNAATATTKAGEASASASTASTQAGISTTKAGESAASAAAALASKNAAATSETNASSSETNALASKNSATTSASTATTQAGIATTQAGISTTKASEAAASAASITGAEANSSASATAAAGSATAASGSATSAANSAASAATALDNFEDKYLGSLASEPTVDLDGNALVSGALYFSQSSSSMQVYDGANWIAASSAGVSSLNLFEYTATAGQTTFSGTDDNGSAMSFITGNNIFALNGIILDPSDFNDTSGTSVVLADAAVVGDLLNCYCFKSFTVADTVSAASGGTFAGSVGVTGNITVTGTVDGRDVAADGAELDALGTAADYATAAQGTLAASALQPTGNGSQLTGINTEPFKPVAVTGATPSLNVGTYNYFDNGTLTANTTVSFASVPTTASWTYTAKGSLLASAAYNLTVAVYESKLSIASQEANLRGLEFSTDGTFLYVIGSSGQDVNQYTLTTAFNITTATYTRAFSISAQENDPTGVDFKPSGTEMYVIGKSGDDVNQYTLSTAWDISSATYTRAFSVSAQETDLTGLDFKTDGTEMYLCGESGDDVNQYTLSTAWDISSATFTRVFSVAAKDTVPVDVKFRSDGLGMFVLGAASDAVHHYTLSTAWDISSATFTTSFSVGSLALSPEGLAFNADGTRMYVGCTNTDSIYQYRTAPYATLTLPSSVVDPPSTAIEETTATYNFTTLDGGTTVSFVNNSPAAAPVPQSTEAGAIGTYSFGRPNTLNSISIGATSSSFHAWQQGPDYLMYYQSYVRNGTSVSQAGTWRCMSGCGGNSDKAYAGLWVRIS